ncbi:MAG: 3'(2'),5'-bisphosphate nucleotidase CysQ [Anaeromicrobium sp.]|uniref:3'(2'),5'-bisphosphate nucleotidase CysQ n=1 Tax=Anaeromicrobium sp. TaxID=1929132 RepID=UPI002ECFF1B5|nr:3'(2'),5'-bisphosphate nucleotidase CysQ [Anaeromicrobium sp.]
MFIIDLSKELNMAKELAIKSGKDILKIYNSSIKVQYKEDKSPLTEADQRSNEIIVYKLKEEFQNYSILSEELKDDKERLNNNWCWIIDPLDGTKEFIKRNGEFTVNIALAYKNKVVLGVIYVPVRDEIYYAVKNEGAFCEKRGHIKKLYVSNKKENLRLVMSRSHASNKLKELIRRNNIKYKKRTGSSLKGCLIARGDAEVYYRFGLTMEWDTAAMECIVKEAGGVFRQMDDTEMIYNRENSLNDKGFYILNNIENKLI